MIVYDPDLSNTNQVGSAISMTYISGQPIVFVGTGQTYPDLKSLDAKVGL